MLQENTHTRSQNNDGDDAGACQCTPAMIKNIACQLLGRRLLLEIPSNHNCRMQCQHVVVRGVVIIGRCLYFVDSLEIFHEKWVLGVPYEIATTIYRLPLLNVGIGSTEEERLAGRIVNGDLCRRIRIMRAQEYLEIQRAYDKALAANGSPRTL